VFLFTPFLKLEGGNMAQVVLQNPRVVYQFFDRMVFMGGGNSLCVEILTEDLYLRSVTREDLPCYEELKVAEKVEGWVRRWENEADPFSAFSIFKKEDNEFVGYISTECKGKLRESVYVIHEREKNHGYGSQAVQAIVHRYLPVLNTSEA
jgi:RimJ/RimL family protein N-acetyltransferase